MSSDSITRIIPRTMSTQHPDNVHMPFFADNSVIEGEDEIKEAFYAFSHIRSREQLWDFEGKEVDNYVVKKLLTRYENFFSRNKLGRDFFLTLRVPNPEYEKNEAKILIETLESIPRSFDIAKIFYGSYDDVPADIRGRAADDQKQHLSHEHKGVLQENSGQQGEHKAH